MCARVTSKTGENGQNSGDGAARSSWTRPSVLGSGDTSQCLNELRPERVGEEITDVLVSQVMEEVGEVAKLNSQPEEQFVLTQKSGVKHDAERNQFLQEKDTRKLLNVWCKENIIDVNEVTGAKNCENSLEICEPEIEHELMAV